MAGSKVDIERFDGNIDFSLWKQMMYAYLSVSGLKDVLVEESPILETTSDQNPEDKKKILADEESRL